MGTGKAATEIRDKLKRWRGTWYGEGKDQGRCTGSKDVVSCDGKVKWDGGRGGDVFRGAKNHIISRGTKKGITSIMGSWGHRGRMIWGERRSEGQGKSFKRQVG